MIPGISINNNTLQDSLLSHDEKSLKSALMRNILCKILDLAKLESPVILIGEIGSGKKRMAQIIHENSARAPFPFYCFYCLDLTNEEYEEAFRAQLHISEDHFILGYNVIEKASRGVLYLDQFSELPPELMFNVIQAFQKGSQQLFRYNQAARPRLILSVNMESYAKLINIPKWESILRTLDPHTIMIPPLRERKEDIPVIVHSFIKTIKSTSESFRELSISESALDTCTSYSWPGNIIQLNNALMQGAVLSHGKTIESHHFPFSMHLKLPYDLEGNNNH